MKIQLKVNIIHTPKLPLSVLELESFDKYIEENLTSFFLIKQKIGLIVFGKFLVNKLINKCLKNQKNYQK
ncbi:MAG: hypothetical protein EAZ08_00725 [Cytophagales bacterium]|nr:MAG: hypothetical protein EAZ08_00725 [Cytophagales bacterium]